MRAAGRLSHSGMNHHFHGVAFVRHLGINLFADKRLQGGPVCQWVSKLRLVCRERIDAVGLSFVARHTCDLKENPSRGQARSYRRGAQTKKAHL